MRMSAINAPLLTDQEPLSLSRLGPQQMQTRSGSSAPQKPMLQQNRSAQLINAISAADGHYAHPSSI